MMLWWCVRLFARVVVLFVYNVLMGVTCPDRSELTLLLLLCRSSS